MQYQVPTSVHLLERNDAKVLTSSECGNSLMDLIIAVAKKQVFLLLAVVKQVNLLSRM